MHLEGDELELQEKKRSNYCPSQQLSQYVFEE